MSGSSHEVDPVALEAAVRAGHEADAVRSRLLWGAGIVFIVLTFIGVIAVAVLRPLMIRSQEKDYPPPSPLAASYGRTEPPAPRLQVDPALDIYDHRKAEQQVLTSYGWVDQKSGVVRIPIERAMGLLVERGIQAPPPAAAAAPSGAAPGAQP
ncbi:hypothetical protein K2Z84_23840 [Candidatus Binatia bacterium]|jgi:hypothetical protein|nr:hypothetical protein [Candidatus Binatia bacterium]